MANKKNTLIIGGSSNFGRSIAQRLLSQGHSLVLTYFADYEKEELNKLFFKIKNKPLLVKLDITDADAIKDFIVKIDSSINNLIYSVSTPIGFKNLIDEEWESYESHWQTQVKGLWFLMKLVAKGKHDLRRVVAIGSNVLMGNPPTKMSSYNVGKYALLGLVKSAAVELATNGATVNLVSPGMSGEGLSGKFPRLLVELEKKNTPLKRLVTASDVAGLVEFILSQDADLMTGMNIPVDGGLKI